MTSRTTILASFLGRLLEREKCHKQCHIIFELRPLLACNLPAVAKLNRSVVVHVVEGARLGDGWLLMSLLRTIMVALLLVAPVAAEEAASQLSVRGEAALKVPADQASLRIVVRAEADTVAEAIHRQTCLWTNKNMHPICCVMLDDRKMKFQYLLTHMLAPCGAECSSSYF